MYSSSGRVARIALAVCIIFAVSAIVLIINLQRDPQIESIIPRIGAPGEIMVLEGSFFGRDQGSVYVAGERIGQSAFLEWTDTRISLRIPGGMVSGLVIVETRSGRSNGILYAHRSQVPVPVRPGDRQEDSLSLLRAELRRGGEFTIQGNSIPGVQGRNALFWQNSDGYRQRLGLLRWRRGSVSGTVPPGAATGSIVLRTADGTEFSVAVTVLAAPGLAPEEVEPETRTWSIGYGLSAAISEGTAADGAVLPEGATQVQALIPVPVDLPSQSVVSLSGLDRVDGGLGVSSTSLDLNSEGLEVYVQAQVEVREIRHTLVEAQVGSAYGGFEPLVSAWTALATPILGYLTDEDAQALRNRSRAVLGAQTNPARKTRILYNWVISELEPDSSAEEFVRTDEVLTAAEAEEAGAANSYAYAMLLSGLLRAGGVPSRVHQGLFAAGNQGLRVHFWVEALLPEIGWIPLDAALGDGMYASEWEGPENANTYYLGSLDARHVSLGVLGAVPDIGSFSVELSEPGPFLSPIGTVFADSAVPVLVAQWREPEILDER